MASLRVSLIIPRGRDGKFILARRAKDKHPFPDVWVTAVGGKANDGESFEDAALREMVEEIGLSSAVSKVCSFHYDNEFKADFEVFTTVEPLSVDSVKPDPGEIQFVKEFSLSELKLMVESNPSDFAPTFRIALLEFDKNIKK